jgi:hypothetical protein
MQVQIITFQHNIKDQQSGTGKSPSNTVHININGRAGPDLPAAGNTDTMSFGFGKLISNLG